MSKALQEIQVPVEGGILHLTQFPVLTAIRVGGKIGTMAAPIVAGLGKGLNLDDLVSGKIGSMLAGGDIDLNKAVPGALTAIAEHLDADKFAALCQELLAGSYWVSTDGKVKIEASAPNGLDTIFGGDVPALFAALGAALRVNNFFGLSAIGRLRGVLKAPAPSPSPAG